MRPESFLNNAHSAIEPLPEPEVDEIGASNATDETATIATSTDARANRGTVDGGGGGGTAGDGEMELEIGYQSTFGGGGMVTVDYVNTGSGSGEDTSSDEVSTKKGSKSQLDAAIGSYLSDDKGDAGDQSTAEESTNNASPANTGTTSTGTANTGTANTGAADTATTNTVAVNAIPTSTASTAGTTSQTVQGDPQASPASTGGAPANAPPAPRTLAPGQFTPPPDAALIEKGALHVNLLESDGTLDAGGAATARADTAFLQKVGMLLGDGAAANLRSVETLVGGTIGTADDGLSSKIGPAERYLATLARSDGLHLAEFHVLANEEAFLDKLAPLFPYPDAAAPVSPAAERELLVRLGGGTHTVDEQHLLIAGGQTQAEPRSSFTTNAPATNRPDPLHPQAQTVAHYATATGVPFPEELRERLDEIAATGGEPDPLLARAVALIGGAVPPTPVEQFLAKSYLEGAIELDDFTARVGDRAFLDSPDSATAAEVFLGFAPGHGSGHDFMNRIYADGHIDLDTFVAETNNEAAMADLELRAEKGQVVYTSADFGAATALIDEMDFHEDNLKEILHPGVNLDEGLPSPEQIAAFHHLAGGKDQNFVELVTTWVQHHNPGYSIRFGHTSAEAKEAGEPKEFFWANNNREVENEFLDSLIADLHAPDGKVHAATGDGVVGGGYSKEKKKGFLGMGKIKLSTPDDSIREDDGMSIKVRIAYEGVSSDGGDELTDHTRWLDDIVYPDGKLAQRLETIGGLPIDLDNNYEGEYPHGAIGHQTRLAFEALDPPLTDGVQIYWVKDQDGVEFDNPKQFGKSVLYAENSRDVVLDVRHGPTVVNAHDSGVTFKNGSGSAPTLESPTPFIVDTADPSALRVEPERESLLDGIVDATLLRPDDLQTIEGLGAKGPEAAAAVVNSEASPFGGLAPNEKLYVFREVLEALPPGGAGVPGTATTPTGEVDAPPDIAPTFSHPASPNAPAAPTNAPSAPTDAPATPSNAPVTAMDAAAIDGRAIPPDRAVALERYTEFLVGEMLNAAEGGAVPLESIESVIGSSIDPDTGEAYLPSEIAHMRAHVTAWLSGSENGPPSTDATPAAPTRPPTSSDRTLDGPTRATVPLPRAVPDATPRIPVPSVPVPPGGAGDGPGGGAASEWELMAQDARVGFTIEVGGEPRFDADAFFDTLYGDPALLERLGTEALDYIGARTIELAMRGGLEPVGGEAA